MLHPGALVADDAIGARVDSAVGTDVDLAAAADAPARRFLRRAWFAAGGAALRTLVAHRGGGGLPLAAIPFGTRRIGPFRICELAGSYWPYRSFPVADDAEPAEIEALLDLPQARAALGRVWRMGPVHADDPALARLARAAHRTGWTLLRRNLGTCYVVDLAALTADGPWPSSKTLRKNRWLERRLAESGPLEFEQVTGGAWDAGMFDRLAFIEGASWVAREAAPRDTKFLHPDSRRVWEEMVRDPELAEMLSASILSIGGEPAAFTFALRAGDTLHIIANSYSERFAEGSPGRILLYRDLQAAVAAGVERIDWGAGDPGYKSQMGAQPGPAIVDCLFVRGAPLAALLRPIWGRIGS